MTPQNRGKISLQIVKIARDLNDHIADKLWSDINPQQPMSVNKVASKMQGRYRFIAHFDKFLQKSVSHFTPSYDGAERLLLKYYKYLLQLKKVMYDNYGMVILKNIGRFIDGRQLMLCRCRLIVLSLCCYTELPKLYIKLFHKGTDTVTNNTKIMIFHFLTLWRHCT